MFLSFVKFGVKQEMNKSKKIEKSVKTNPQICTVGIYNPRLNQSR